MNAGVQFRVMQTREISVMVLIRKSEDLPDVWVSHCLNFDVVSQGASIEEANRSLWEAVQLVIEDDCEQGLDPQDRPMAPAEDWGVFLRVLQSARSLHGLDPAELERVRIVVTEMVVSVPARNTKSEPSLFVTPAWQIAAFEGQHRGLQG